MTCWCRAERGELGRYRNLPLTGGEQAEAAREALIPGTYK